MPSFAPPTASITGAPPHLVEPLWEWFGIYALGHSGMAPAWRWRLYKDGRAVTAGNKKDAVATMRGAKRNGTLAALVVGDVRHRPYARS